MCCKLQWGRTEEAQGRTRVMPSTSGRNLLSMPISEKICLLYTMVWIFNLWDLQTQNSRKHHQFFTTSRKILFSLLIFAFKTCIRAHPYYSLNQYCPLIWFVLRYPWTQAVPAYTSASKFDPFSFSTASFPLLSYQFFISTIFLGIFIPGKRRVFFSSLSATIFILYPNPF